MNCPLSVQLRFFQRLVGVGIIGALSLAVAMLVSVDRVLDNFWTAMAARGVAGL